MFHVNRGGDHRIYHNNNSAPATLKLLAFLFVIGLVGGIAWAFTQAVQSVTAAMGRTWTHGNNDHIIRGWNTLIIISGVVAIVLITLAILPWLVANWQRAVNPPRPRDDWRVLPGDNPKLGEPGPVEHPFGLLVDGQHEESFIDGEIVPEAQPVQTAGQWL